MPSFDIVKTADIDKTYRVARIMGDYDVKIEHSNEHFVGEINMPDTWHIGAIVGGSGTGKSTIAKELFGNQFVTGFQYNAKSVVDDMPKDCSMDEIERTFYAVGFGSVPSWLKPYQVLSNGEKMRVDLARAMLERDFIVFDDDILEWLQPDWVLDTNEMRCFFGTAHALKNDLKSGNVGAKNGKSLGVIII